MFEQPARLAICARIEELFPSWRGRQPYAERIDEVAQTLARNRPGLDAALSFEEFEAAHASGAVVQKYNHVPPLATALFARLPAEVRAPWLCALMLWHMRRFPTVFAATGLHPEFALHYGDAFHRILDQIEADPSFADLPKDRFLKDLWITRGVMLPAFAQVWWPRSGLSARQVLGGGLGAATHVFLRCGGRRPFLEGHTHDPVAKAYWNERGWREALRLAALALSALPTVRGAFGTAWFYDPAVKALSPRIAFAQDLQAGEGAFQLKVGSNADAIANATATSASRREAYRAGTYLPTDYALIWSRHDLLARYGA